MMFSKEFCVRTPPFEDKNIFVLMKKKEVKLKNLYFCRGKKFEGMV